MNLTNESNTSDFLKATQGMKIVAYTGAFYPTTTLPFVKQKNKVIEPMFLQNIKNAVRIIKNYLLL